MTMERETASSNNTPQENESSDLAVAETTASDSGIKKVEDPKSDAQFEDTVEKSVDGEMNETPNIPNGEEEGENPITVDKDDENAKIEDMKGNNMAQSVQDTSEDDDLDDEEDVMWEDDEEYSEEGSEKAVAIDDEVNEEDSINEEEDSINEEEDPEEDAENAGANDEGNAAEGDQKKAEAEKKIAKGNVGEAEAEKKIAKGNVGEAEEHNREKVEVILEKAKKSRGRRGNKVGEEALKKLDTGDKAGSSQKRKGKKRVESMGMIFMCSSKTKKDCYKYRVLGLPESKKDMVEKIYTGMRLFLYDVDLKLMYGIYKAAGPGGYNIEPRAFKSQFPSQVRFTVLDDCLPLAEEKFKNIIQENYYTKTKFDCKLNSEQVKKLCKAFVSTSKVQLPQNIGIRREAKKREAKKQLPVHRDHTRRRKRGDDERRPPLREEARYERPRKRTRQAISPTRQPLPPPIRSTVPLYPYNRTLDGEAYRRDSYLERRDHYGDSRDRDPLLKRGDHYRDERDPYLERRDPYRDRRDSYLVDRDPEPYLVRHNSEAYLMARDTESYPVGRELRDPYRLRRDPYPEHHRDGRASYLESRVLLEDAPRSEAYTSYRSDPILDSWNEYREDRRPVYRDPPYRREEVVERLGGHERTDLESRRHDPYVSYRERPLYAEPLYSVEYPSRSGMAREYRL